MINEGYPLQCLIVCGCYVDQPARVQCVQIDGALALRNGTLVNNLCAFVAKLIDIVDDEVRRINTRAVKVNEVKEVEIVSHREGIETSSKARRAVEQSHEACRVGKSEIEYQKRVRDDER
jgi:hypothetical protein